MNWWSREAIEATAVVAAGNLGYSQLLETGRVNYAMRLICSKRPRTPSEDSKSLDWVPLVKRREVFRLSLVHRCVRNNNQEAALAILPLTMRPV